MAGYRPSFILQFYFQRLMPRWIHNYTRVLMPYLNRCDSLIVINNNQAQSFFMILFWERPKNFRNVPQYDELH